MTTPSAAPAAPATSDVSRGEVELEIAETARLLHESEARVSEIRMRSHNNVFHDKVAKDLERAETRPLARYLSAPRSRLTAHTGEDHDR